MLECANGDPEVLKTVITGDETWVYGHDSEAQVQSSQWKNSSCPRHKEAQRVQSKVKVLLAVFCDYRGIVYHSYASESQTVNKEYYLEVIRHLRDADWCKRPDLWASRNWQLHHDNAPAHSSHLIQSFLANHGIPVVRQAPYSPYMAPCDFWLLPKLKRPLKCSRFDGREDIMRNATKELRSLPEEAFQKGFQQWKERWTKCVESQGPTLKVIWN
jgi:hypothetical protein